MVKTTVGRAGWDETVRELAKQANAQISHAPEPAAKRETRQRRAAATRHRWVSAATSDAEVAELREAARIDYLLETNYYEKEQQEDDDEYRVEEEDDDDAKRRPQKKQRAPKPTTTAQHKSAKDLARERRHRPKNVAQILLDDFLGKEWDPNQPDWISALGGRSRYPAPKTCVITGKEAKYTDPVTGCPYADAEAFAQLRENPPPWVKLANNGAPYFEAIQQIKAERLAKLKKMQQDDALLSRERAAQAAPGAAQPADAPHY